MDWPDTRAGAVGLVVAGAVVLYLFVQSVAGLALGVLLLALAVWLAYVVLGRINDWARHGKPLIRGDWGGGDGGA